MVLLGKIDTPRYGCFHSRNFILFFACLAANFHDIISAEYGLGSLYNQA